MKNNLSENKNSNFNKKIFVTEISVKKLIEFSNKKFKALSGRSQPFLEYSAEALEKLSESIKECGIINPLVVREKGEDKYEILSGRNRFRAAKQLNMRTVPAIVRKGITDEEAILLMLDSNLRQRRNLSYSEKAYAYKMRMDIMNRQGKRTDLTLCNDCTKIDSLKTLANEHKDSRRTVAYYIRLTFLLPQLLKHVDDKTISFTVGVALSYLSVNAQSIILKNIIGRYKITKMQVEKIRELEKNGFSYEQQILSIFKTEPSPNKKYFRISRNKLKDFPELLANEAETERLFLEFLRQYKESEGVEI